MHTLPVRLGWWRRRHSGRHHWSAPLPLVEGAQAPWPPALAGQEILSVATGPAGTELGVVHDRRAGTVSATLRVEGRHFGLVGDAEADTAVARWGEALGAFVRERSPVSAVRWSEWAAPAGTAEHLAFIARHTHDPGAPAAVAYRELVEEAGPQATRHEVLVTVSVGLGRARDRGAGALSAATATLATEMALFAERLGAAGLGVSAPLSAAELSRAVRSRLDPTALRAMDRRSTRLGAAAGLVAPHSAGPLATVEDWEWWRADGSFHRSLYVSEWPRMAMPAAWMGGLLGWSRAVRSVTVVAEPVSPRESRTTVRRQATKLASDAEHRAQLGLPRRGCAAAPRPWRGVRRSSSRATASSPTPASSPSPPRPSPSSTGRVTTSPRWRGRSGSRCVPSTAATLAGWPSACPSGGAWPRPGGGLDEPGPRELGAGGRPAGAPPPLNDRAPVRALPVPDRGRAWPRGRLPGHRRPGRWGGVLLRPLRRLHEPGDREPEHGGDRRAGLRQVHLRQVPPAPPGRRPRRPRAGGHPRRWRAVGGDL